MAGEEHVKPYISVVIPTCGRIEYLNQAIDSLLRQTLGDFEAWIVNDCPDDHQAICGLIASKHDRRLHVISNPTRRGANYSRNLGIRESCGSIIAFLDDDDLWHERKLEVHLRAHENNHRTGLIYSRVSYLWDLPNPVYREKCGTSITPVAGSLIASGKMCPPTTSCVTVRRECFSRVGLFEAALTSFQDWDMWIRIAEQYGTLVIEYPLVIFRQHSGVRVSRTFSKRQAGLDEIRKKWDGKPDVDRAMMRFACTMFADAAYNAAVHGERLEAGRRIMEFLIARPTTVFGLAGSARMAASALLAAVCGRATLSAPFRHAFGYKRAASLAGLLARPVPNSIALGKPEPLTHALR